MTNTTQAADGAEPRKTPTGEARPIAEELTDMLRGRLPALLGVRILQVWDVSVTDEQDRTTAAFRCTQLLL
ncbi:hypothetical protein [Mycobacterium sp. Lab-001]|uniref:hypothetical protein n=1 Tax=Mycobacterium sp. Lab-001 TaxID=3410136 RepID=UPI003D186D29